MGILPLGTGNDLSRVLGWTAAFDDDGLLPLMLDRMEHAQIKMLDRSVAGQVVIIVIIIVCSYAWQCLHCCMCSTEQMEHSCARGASSNCWQSATSGTTSHRINACDNMAIAMRIVSYSVV